MNYNYYQPGASLSGCPGTAMTGGWYAEGSSTPVASSYINPSTGAAYTPAELGGLGGGGTIPTGGATVAGPTEYTPPTLTEGVGPGGLTYEQYLAQAPEGTPEADIEAHWLEIVGKPQHVGETRAEVGPGAIAGEIMPTFGEGAAAGIPTPTVTPAPPYEISPEMQEMMDLYGDTLTDWVTSGGYGLSPEVQAQMIQQQTDTLKAREQEAIRVMTNNMERRGITNSGYLQANTNQITSNTTVALAGAIADVQIKSALMKMASFEKGMGAMAQYLGFLSEQSQLAYAPEFATWQAEQMATMQAWQGKMDIYKMELNQAYQTQNMQLQAQLTSQLNQEQNAFNLLLAEMEIEANQKIAMAQGIGGIFGTVLGFLFGK